MGIVLVGWFVCGYIWVEIVQHGAGYGVSLSYWLLLRVEYNGGSDKRETG